MRLKSIKKRMLTFFILALLTVPSAVSANILITPTKVVIEGRDRFAVVTLVNNGDVTKSYEMGWVYMKMTEDTGSYAQIDAPVTDFDLSEHMVFSPRRVTLAPGAKQKVRLALRRPSEIPEGDYHVHMRFKALPNTDDALKEKREENKVEASVQINVSYTIPVILRVGEADVGASIGQLSLGRDERTGALQAKVPVTRTGGPYSILGHMYVYHIAPDGSEELVGEVSNANIFPEIDKRVFSPNINKNITGGALRVVLRHADRDAEYIYAEKTFPLQ